MNPLADIDGMELHFLTNLGNALARSREHDDLKAVHRQIIFWGMNLRLE
jgi:hypothetical protein